MISVRRFVAAWLAGAACAHAAEATLTIQTTDGFAVTLGEDGRARAIRLDAREVSLASPPVLFRLRDAAKGGAFTSVPLTATEAGGAIALKSRDESAAVRIAARITSRGA